MPVRKKGTAQYRWAIDFRALNQVTERDSFPLPSIEANLQSLAGSAVFSCLDSAGAFHCINVSEESRPLTAFGTPLGLFQFRKMPFGVLSGPSIYSRTVLKALEHLPSHFWLVYLDDIIIHSKNTRDHLNHLEKILDAHARAGMKLKLSKCLIAKKTVTYLGHQVSEDGITMTRETNKGGETSVNPGGSDLFRFVQ